MKTARFARTSSSWLALLLWGSSCTKGSSAGHDHEHGHDHGDAHAREAEEGAPTLALTRWTDRYELFMEMTAPTPGKPVAYHAHVTDLDGYRAVTEGSLRVRFRSAGSAASEASAQALKRPGIFVFESPAPAAGKYEVEAVYEHAGRTAVFDCGTVAVASPPVAPPDEPGSTITFLKEAQWKIPFGTAWPEERLLAAEVELPATVEPAGSDQLTIGAPTTGRFYHDPKRPLAEGSTVKKGDVVGRIAPSVAGEDYTRLVSAVEEARVSTGQLEREIARIAPLVEQKLLPERRLIELRNELETQRARLASAGNRVARVTTPSAESGIAVKSTLEGVVSQVLVGNGEPVDSGAPLVRIGGTDHVWLRARFVARPSTAFQDAAPTAVRVPSGARIALEPERARFLSVLPIVDPASRLATWIVDVAPGSRDTGAAELRPGTSVVLAVRQGRPKTALAVRREAVVEINTRPYVFVQVDGEHFEKRAVTLGTRDGGFVEILSGVQKGERVVERGGFDIHLASLMGTVESHRH